MNIWIFLAIGAIVIEAAIQMFPRLKKKAWVHAVVIVVLAGIGITLQLKPEAPVELSDDVIDKIASKTAEKVQDAQETTVPIEDYMASVMSTNNCRIKSG